MAVFPAPYIMNAEMNVTQCAEYSGNNEIIFIGILCVSVSLVFATILYMVGVK